MTVRDVCDIIHARVVCGEKLLGREVKSGFGSDLMSDVLSFAKEKSILLTGLCTTEVIETAFMLDIVAVVFVRDKKPDEKVIALAKEKEIPVLCTGHRLFSACGLLYERGLRAGADYERFY